MKVKVTLPTLTLLVGFALMTGCAGEPKLNFGDDSAGNLIYEALYAHHEGKEKEALAYADRIITKYGDEGRAINAGLSDYVPQDKNDSKHVPLNVVACAYWIRGENLLKQGDIDGATKAYETVVSDYNYAQVFSRGEEWFRPGDLSKEKLVEIKSLQEKN